MIIQELKLKYYNLMIELCQHDHKYIAICQHYRAVFETPQIQESEERWKEVRYYISVSACLMTLLTSWPVVIDTVGIEECCVVCPPGSLRP